MSDDDWKLVRKLQERELRELTSPRPLSRKRQEIRVRTWRELAEVMAA